MQRQVSEDRLHELVTSTAKHFEEENVYLRSICPDCPAEGRCSRRTGNQRDDTADDEFSRLWLGINDPKRWRDAVEMALLGDWVDNLGRGVLGDPAVVNLLRHHAQIEHESRTATALRRLTPTEAAVAATWAKTPELSWQQAALAERVRRKLKRLGRQYTALRSE